MTQDQGVPLRVGLSPTVEPVPVSPPDGASIPNALDPSTWSCGCIAHQVKAMMTLNEASAEMPVLSFATISAWSGLTIEQTRSSVRSLASKGVAEYWPCCWSDDGEPKGAGYALTKQGRSAAQAIEARSVETERLDPKGESAVHEVDASEHARQLSKLGHTKRRNKVHAKCDEINERMGRPKIDWGNLA